MNMSDFENLTAGTKLVCVDAWEGEPQLVNGEIYTYSYVSGAGYIRLQETEGMGWRPDRFELCPTQAAVAEPTQKETGAVGTGMKFDGDKPRMDLLFDGMPHALEAVGQVLTFGARKYAAHSWQTVEGGEQRYKAALIRHLTAVGKGEALDSESNLHHLAHLACNALFILELELRKCKE
ncbi:hypothetical protein [Pantoea phage LIMEzero]|uniref:dATP/dGTP diphosphohydrolase N-terminal domain-containing protein n=1 Tax=Pantoea phage LIMEzero TaxID=943335 RepID=F4N9T4_9CAUD|nr:hypothetical protein LIMEzero_ORF31 [Pantoea phage LIMEzero]CBY88562.1 hypothetical protein [Pantoea phage LIMEzero]